MRKNIDAGKCHFYFKSNKETTIVTKGNMILFRPGEPRVYYYYAAEKTEVYWVHFTGWKVEEYLERYELCQSTKTYSIPVYLQTILGFTIRSYASFKFGV